MIYVIACNIAITYNQLSTHYVCHTTFQGLDATLCSGTPSGIMSFLKNRFGGGQSDSVVKPRASSKPAARATTKATSKPATTKAAPKAAAVRKATAAPVVKEVVGNAGGGLLKCPK